MGNIKTIKLETKKHCVREFQNTNKGIQELNEFILELRKEENENINIKFTCFENEDSQHGMTIDDYNDVDKIEAWIENVRFIKGVK